jgi:hypothetical protein
MAMSRMGYLITGVPDRYAFEMHLGPSQQVVSVRRDVRPTPVATQERDSTRSATQERLQRTEPGWSWSGSNIPNFKPFYAALHVGDDGRIWVPVVGEAPPRAGSMSLLGNGVGRAGSGVPRRDAPPARDAAKPHPALYDVYEADGTYLGQVKVPPRVATVVRRGDYVWGIEFDEDDVQRVVRFRIMWK